MPYKFEQKHIKKEDDKRVKLDDNDKMLIRSLYKEGCYSQRKLASMFNVSRRLIQFVIDPLKLKANLETRKGKSYYDKEKNTAAMKRHRKWKKELDKRGKLI